MDEIDALIKKFGDHKKLILEIERRSKNLFTFHVGVGRKPIKLYEIFALIDAFDDYSLRFSQEAQSVIAGKIIRAAKDYQNWLTKENIYGKELKTSPGYLKDLAWIIRLKPKTVINHLASNISELKKRSPLMDSDRLTTHSVGSYQDFDDPESYR